ncbi:MAG: sodium:proton antiporter [Planctomycetota bacterium]
MNLLIAIVLGGMFGVGVFQVLRRNVIRSAIGLMLMGNAVNLLLIHCGAYDGVIAPYTTMAEATPELQVADPLPQALVLTAIVIGLGGFAFVLGMVVVLTSRYRTGDTGCLSELKH